MFGPAGHAYVYFTMGVHYCLNITTEREGVPGAVLIRALEPLEGLEAMRRNRALSDERRLATGPGNLTKALGVDMRLNGEDMITSSKLFVEKGEDVGEVGVSPRVGISAGKSFKWRFFVNGSPFVSKWKAASPAQNP